MNQSDPLLFSSSVKSESSTSGGEGIMFKHAEPAVVRKDSGKTIPPETTELQESKDWVHSQPLMRQAAFDPDSSRENTPL